MVPAVVAARGRWSQRFRQRVGQFENNRQQDANEAFNLLMEDADNVDWMKLAALAPGGARHSTPYYKIFGGALRRRMRCLSCHCCVSKREESFASLMVELPADRRQQSVDELVQRFRARETPTDYVCEGDRCGREGTTEISIDVVRWPRVLCVQLKRFEWVRQTGRWRKVQTRVVWQEYEDLHGGAGACRYHLRCLCNHGGNAFGGHYTSYVRGHGGEWYFCDDESTPRRVDVGEVLRCEGYMAFYEKEEAAPNASGPEPIPIVVDGGRAGE